MSDGTSAAVFTRSNNKNDGQMFTYACRLCGVANLPGERCLQTHIAGRKHQTKFAKPIIDAEAFRSKNSQPKPQKSNLLIRSFTFIINKIIFFLVSMNIAPGEPVPPGFENEVKRISELQGKLDKCKDEALMGLEYIMELTVASEDKCKEPYYHCILCDKRGDPRTIMVHITSYNHRLKFLVIINIYVLMNVNQ